jgi:hypothetical protein
MDIDFFAGYVTGLFVAWVYWKWKTRRKAGGG